jgi:hypothetical protein
LIKKSNKPEEVPFVPILDNFDQASMPLGYVDLAGEKCVLKLNDKKKVTVDDINSGRYAFAPTYIITREEKGVVKEIIVDSFSLVALK